MQVIIPPKAKADFEKWYVEQPYYVPYSLHNFDRMPFAMQQGVYMEYLRERGISVEVYCLLNGSWVGEAMNVPQTLPERLDRMFKKSTLDYNEALAAAITAAFLKVEETLND